MSVFGIDPVAAAQALKNRKRSRRRELLSIVAGVAAWALGLIAAGGLAIGVFVFVVRFAWELAGP